MCGIFPENMKIAILLSSIALGMTQAPASNDTSANPTNKFVTVVATQVNPAPRSVNVALETSFLFDPKDMNDNKSFINNIRRFLDKLYKTLEPQTAEKLYRTEAKPRVGDERRLGEFIEIMQSIGEKIMNMTASKIKESLDTIHVKVKNVTEKHQTKFSQVLPTRTQGVIKDLINSWMNIEPEAIKIFINSTVRENKPLLATFARRMNSYYSADDVKRLNKILKKFKRYIDTNKDTTKIVKKLLHNTVFKKYDSLNESAKAAVMGDLKMLSEFLIEKNSLTGSHEFVEKDELPDDITYNVLRRSIDEKIRNAREKREDKKKGTNDFFEGNVELLVEPPQNS